MSDQYLGEIRMVGFNFAPVGWALCNGQTLAISQNAALFSLLGTNYGGNGTSTFQLPDLQGRVPIHQGTGAGLSTYVIGEQAGTENVTLLTNNMPAHSHLMNVNSNAGNVISPAGSILAAGNNGDSRNPQSFPDFTQAAGNGTLAVTAIQNSGGNVPHQNIQPFLCVNFIIALTGIFPSRN